MAETQYALLIASSTFPKEARLQPLRCPENDVDGMRDRLTSPPFGLFNSEQVKVFKNAPHYEVLLAIEQVLRSAGKNDLVLIYYSGHGEVDEAGRLHLATSNSMLDALASTSIPVHVLKSYIEVARSNRIVLILDCCYAGAAGKMFNFRSDPVGEELKQVSSGQGIYVLTASTAVQTAQERETDRYGLMTKHILDALTEPDADVDQDGFISMDELYTYVHSHVRREVVQTPEKFAYAIQGNLFIAKTGQIPREERRKQIRSLLFELAANNQITENLLNQTLAINARHPTSLSGEARRQAELLDQLYDKRIVFGQFVERWYNVTASPAVQLAEVTPTAVASPSAGPGKLFQLSLKRTLPKHPKGVTSGALSPGGRMLATGGGDGTVRIWNVATGEMRFQEAIHSGPVWAMAFSPDGAELASGGADGIVQVTSVAAGLQAQQFAAGQTVLSLSYHGSKTLAAGGLGNTISLLRPPLGNCARIEAQDSDVRSLLFSGDHLIVGGSDSHIRIYGGPSWNLERTLEGHRAAVLAFAASTADRMLASGGRDGTVRLWDLTAWVAQAVLRGHKHSIQCVAIHPNGSTIISGSADGTLRFWDVRSLQNTGTLESGHICVNVVAISPRGDWVATGGADQTVRFWLLR
jgi:WD40 repeat protein